MITTLVLGARDPEMDAVGRLALTARLDVVWAKKAGKPVAYDQMYAADWPEPAPGQLWVECSPPNGKSAVDFADHHEPGDPGYGRPPAEFWEASSIGQVWGRLHPGKVPPEALRVVAAVDHCPRAAYSGECPGVDAGTVVSRSIEQLALGSARDANDVVGDIYRHVCRMQAERPRRVAGCRLHVHSKVLAGLPEWLLVREAALWHKVAVAARVQDGSGGEWLKLAGHATPRLVRAFMEGLAVPGVRMTRVYGDPLRGYAGGLVVG